MHAKAKIIINCAAVAAITSIALYAVIYFDAFLWRTGWHPMYQVNSESWLFQYHRAIAFGYDTLRFAVFGFVAAWLICKLQPKALLVYVFVAIITLASFLGVWQLGIRIPAVYWVYLVTIPLFCALLSVRGKREVRA